MSLAQSAGRRASAVLSPPIAQALGFVDQGRGDGLDLLAADQAFKGHGFAGTAF
jgi:hypothetical protein